MIITGPIITSYAVSFVRPRRLIPYLILRVGLGDGRLGWETYFSPVSASFVGKRIKFYSCRTKQKRLLSYSSILVPFLFALIPRNGDTQMVIIETRDFTTPHKSYCCMSRDNEYNFCPSQFLLSTAFDTCEDINANYSTVA